MMRSQLTVKPVIDAKVLDVHAFSKRKFIGDCPFSIANSAQFSGSAHSPIQRGPKSKCFGTHNSADAVGYGTVKQTSHSWASVDQALLSTTPTVSPETSKLDHG
ncbi:uncharacterized protein TNCV_2238811 [Trichonephila clavipes]|nr:uncharacterized protein TNCV_2238811 [Trichonephila clavipes]